MNVVLFAIDWNFMNNTIAGEKVSSYVWFVGIILFTILMKRVMARWLTFIGSRFTGRMGEGQHTVLFRTLLRKPVELLLQAILFYVAVSQLDNLLDHSVIRHKKDATDKLILRMGDVVDHLFLLFVIVFTSLLVSRIIDFIYRVQLDKAKSERDVDRMQVLPLMKEVLKLLVWSICFFWVLGTVFHVNIPALITGLGIGGVAVALAAKESVENLFASFTILLDKPFKTGDIVKLGELEGVVERIGFRSTRLRNNDGAANIIPNKKLVDENLENLSRRDVRRVRLGLNMKYNIPADALQLMVAEMKAMLSQVAQVKEPIEVLIETFGENTFLCVIVYHLPYPLKEGQSLNEIKQEVNLKAYEIAGKYRKLGTAYVLGKG
ncbi:MAG: mechanosensitive ion channel family protein [Bacteroidota bacterium]